MTYHPGNTSLSRVNDFAVFPGLRVAMLKAKARFVVLLSFSCVGAVRALAAFASNRSTFVRPLACAINDWRRSWHLALLS